MKIRSRRAFTLVELLVVIGVIAVLIGMLLPALARAQRQSKMVKCQSNLRQIGQALVMYAQKWNGWLYPPDLTSGHPREQRWPVHVFKPPQWNPPVMLCPADENPLEEHSYILNNHLYERGIKMGTRTIRKLPTTGVAAVSRQAAINSSDVIVMGEKRTEFPDYYMANTNYYERVEHYRHGINVGSNYLFMDWHVAPQLPKDAKGGLDPWDIQAAPPQPPPPGT
jgi:prepilin-type N-terminal cleavage/methylation domain-containing protein/prepilin-type processing-associated H-X9-DG protein